MKTFNFKKVLAVILALVMVLSVCTMSFSVSAETETPEDTSDVSTDLSYLIINDGSEKCAGWANPQQSVICSVAHNGKSAARVVAQALPNTGGAYFWLKNNLGTLTYEDLADINTYSFYISNPMDVDLSFEHHRYVWDDENISVAGLAALNGYIYLFDINSNKVYITNPERFITVPSGFEGYVIYDISDSANSGDGRDDLLEAELGNLTNVDIIKRHLFAGMAFNVKNTEKMFNQAWFYDDVAISTKTATELIDYLAKAPVGYVASQFNKPGSAANGYDSWWAGAVKQGIVEYGDFEKKGILLQTADISGVEKSKAYGTSSMYLQNWVNAAHTATDSPLAPVNAVAFSMDLKIEGSETLQFQLYRNSEKDDIVEKEVYAVSKDGTWQRKEGDALSLSDFEGTLYVVFDQVETSYGSTEYVSWSEYAANLENFNAFGIMIYKESTAACESSAILSDFALYYNDFDITEMLKGNDIKSYLITDGSKYTNLVGSVKLATVSVVDSYDMTGKAIRVVTTADQQYQGFRTPSVTSYIPDPNGVTAYSFRLKVPYLISTTTDTVKISVDFNGTPYNSYDYAATLVNKDGTVSTLSANSAGKYPIPFGFDGTVILNLTGEGKIRNTSDTTKNHTFEEFLTAAANKLSYVAYNLNWRSSGVKGEAYYFDDGYLVTEDFDSYVNNISSKYKEEIYNKAYTINNGSRKHSQEYNLSNFFANSVASAYDVHTAENNVSISAYTTNTAGAADGSVKFGNRVKDIRKYLDLSKATALSYWTSIPNLEDGNYLRLHHSIDSLTTKATVIAISDDGETVIIKNGVNHAGELKGFTGRIYFLFDKNFSIKYNDVAYSWEDYVKICEEEIAAGTRTNSPLNAIKLYAVRGDSSVVDSNTLYYFDDYKLHFEDDMLKAALAKANIDAIFSARDDINPALETKGWYTVADEAVAAAPNGTAIHFAQVDGAEVSGAMEYQLPNKTLLTAAEQLANEAVSFWVSVPETQAKGMSFYPRFAGGGNYYVGTYITVDQNTGAVTYTSYPENSNYALKLPAGFTGYVILPIKYAQIAQGHGNGNLVDLTTALSTTGLGNVTLYWDTNSGTEWYLGEIDFVSNIADFMTDLGVAQVSGDINADNDVDVRDLVRLKKFNADNRYSIAFQNADIDENGVLDSAAELIASRKQLLGIDPTVEADYDIPEIGHGIYHHYSDQWDAKYSDIVAEKDLVNTYFTSNIYELKQIRANGGASWLYLNNDMFGAKAFDSSEDTEISDAFKKALADKVKVYKKNKVWNVIAGFHTEEVLMGTFTVDQFITLTKYLRETYPEKRIMSCLSVYEIKGSTVGDITYPKADYETYQYVTDIGYDWYDSTYDKNVEIVNELMNAIAIKNEDETITRRTDIKYWFFPTAWSRVNAEGQPTWSEKEVLTQINDVFSKIFFDDTIVPTSQRGGIMFYNWKSFMRRDSETDTAEYSCSGLDRLISEFGYNNVPGAMIDFVNKIK